MKTKPTWRLDLRVLERLPKVEDLHLQGYPNTHIAEELTVDEATIRNDLKRIQILWRERVGDAVESKRARSVAVYRRIQHAAWQEFQAVRDTSPNKPQYLNTIKQSEDSIAKILGLEGGPDGEGPANAITFTIQIDNAGGRPVNISAPGALSEARARYLQPGAILDHRGLDKSGENDRVSDLVVGDSALPRSTEP